MFDLIYCAGGNPRLSQIAYEEGWKLGYRSDHTMGDFPVTFVDIDYKQPDFQRHLREVQKRKPRYATVPDLSEQKIDQADIDRAIHQAEILAEYCEIPLIVPKLSGQIALLPPAMAIGYSVQSGYGGAQYFVWELMGRRVHLLGGSPYKQIQAYLHISAIATIMSIDGSYAKKQAIKYAEYWSNHTWIKHPKVHEGEKDLYLECFRWSCRNLMHAWQRLV